MSNEGMADMCKIDITA